jgi:HKD family nuclease
MLYKNGIDLHDELINFINRSSNLFIYVPYIKYNSLVSLIENAKNIQAVIVRWEPMDLITGSSDIEIYPYLQENGIALYRNHRLHLKAFVDCYRSAFIGSANISQRALNYPESHFYNYELATVIENLTLEDRLYFNTVENDSMLITEAVYEKFRSQLEMNVKKFPLINDFDIEPDYPDKNFLISALPMTYDLKTLFKVYERNETINELEVNCALHDLALYRIPLGLPINKFKNLLKESFFRHPFIRAFLSVVDHEGEIYFGKAKDWIQKNCANVPVPRKWEITENIQILYRWISELSSGVYSVDQPNYSERLFLKL